MKAAAAVRGTGDEAEEAPGRTKHCPQVDMEIYF